jgi:protein-S-isoprenylcysteine O-methyltransferase Ste14
MDTDRKALIFNGFGLLASIFILLSGAIVAQVMIYLLVQIFGALLIIWALITIKVSKKNKELPKGYFFIHAGPYEIVRHPVYAGYLLIMISFVEIEFTFLRLIALIILCIAVMMKIIREEVLMKQKVPEYPDYMKKTKAIIPYLL